MQALASSLPSRQIARMCTNRVLSTTIEAKQRFYVQVETVQCPPPWQHKSSTRTLASPVSSGVDDTNSASGVSIGILSRDDKKKWLGYVDQKSWYTVRLDGRSLRTPMGDPLSVPSETLATGMAAEWNSVESVIRPNQLPLMTLASTAIDQAPRNPQSYRDGILRFLETDTVGYFAEEPTVRKRQEVEWAAIHKMILDWSGHEIGLSSGFGKLPHAPGLIETCRDYVNSLDAWKLTILYSLASETKSFCIGFSLLRDCISIKEAVAAARVEEEFNIENWGLVEGGHDYDRLNASVQIRAALIFRDSLQSH